MFGLRVRPACAGMVIGAALSIALVGAIAPSGSKAAPIEAPALAYVPADTATRVLDTRLTPGRTFEPGSRDHVKGIFRGGEPRSVALGVPAEATAALVNIALVGPPGGDAGWAVAWRPGESMPPTSNVNTGSEEWDANVAVVGVDETGSITIMTSVDLDVVVDLVGWFVPADGPVAAGRFHALTPTRLVDTRRPAGSGNEYEQSDATEPIRPPGALATLTRVPVRGRAGVPEEATIVAVTVTARAGSVGGFVTAYPSGAPRPETSTLSVIDGHRANLAVVRLGADGAIDLYASQAFGVIVDVVGWFTDENAPASTEGLLHLTEPRRLADSRWNVGFPTLGTPGTAVLEPSGVPISASAVLQNITYVSHQAGWVCATPNPWTGGEVSVQNAGDDQDRAALTLTRLGSGPEPRLRYCSENDADIVVDLLGWIE